MSLVVFDKVSLWFGEREIVDELDLRVAEQDRIGLIGPNGSGKSTLLKMLAGEQAADGGRITLRNGLRLGYLPQDLAVASGKTLLDFMSAKEVAELVDGLKRVYTTVAVGGSLRPEQLKQLKGVAPDYFAVRTSACAAGKRDGVIDATRVKKWKELLAGVRV